MKLITFACGLLLFMHMQVIADQPFVSQKLLVNEATLIVTGKIASIESIKFSEELHPRKIAIIRVDSIEKGALESGFVLASIGYFWPNNAISSQDVILDVGDYGKWLLVQEKSGLYKLNNPDSFIGEPSKK